MMRNAGGRSRRGWRRAEVVTVALATAVTASLLSSLPAQGSADAAAGSGSAGSPRVAPLNPTPLVGGGGSIAQPLGPPLTNQAPGLGNWTVLGDHMASEPDYSSNPPAQWGVNSGRVTGIAVNPTNPSNVFVGTAGGGVWTSSDGGTTWATHTDNQPDLAIGAIAVDASGLLVFAGTGEGNLTGDSIPGDGILRSSNGGGTWTMVAPALAGHRINSIAVDRTTSGTHTHVLVASDEGLYVSTDGGFTFSENAQIDTVIHTVGSKPATGSLWQIVQDPTTAAVFWAVAGDGCQTESGDVLESLDGGNTWTVSQDLAALEGLNVGRMGLGVGTTGHLYGLLSDCKERDLDVIKKTSYGGAWGSAGAAPRILGKQGSYDNVVAVDPTNNQDVIFAGVFVYRSTDGASTFRDIGHVYKSTGVIHPDFHAITFTGAGSFYIGNDGGVWKTSNLGLNWTDVNQGLGTLQFYLGSASDLTHFVGGTQDNGAAGYFGAGTLPGLVEETQVGDGVDAAVDPTVGSTTFYTSGPSLQLAVGTSTTPSSNTPAGPCNQWVRPTTGIGCADPVDFVSPFVIDPSNPKRLLAATNQVYVSTTGGVPTGAAGWKSISPPLTAATCQKPYVDDITSLDVGPAGESNTMITTSFCGSVWMTIDGQTWTPITGNLPAFDKKKLASPFFTGWAWMSSAKLNPWNHSEAWVTSSGTGPGHVFHTTTAGSSNTWVDISANLPKAPVQSVVDDPRNPGTIYVGTAAGVYVCTTCGGASPSPSWARAGGGLPNAWVTDLTFTRDDSSLIAWTHGRGVWALSTPDTHNQIMSFTGTIDPYTISPGPDGLWWASGDANNISVITGDWTTDTEHHIAVATANAEPFAVATAANGTEWFTEFGANQLGEVPSSTSSSAFEFSAIGMPDGACTGPDGNVYISAFSTDHVDAFDVTRHPVAGYGFSSATRGCVAAPDGTVWVAEPEVAKVGKIVPGGAATEFAIPGGAGSEQMTVGPDGNVWFTDPGTGSIGRIMIGTSPPTITEFAVGAGPEGITAGAQGDLWVALNGADAIVRVSAKGKVIKTYPLSAGSGVYGIARGPDQSIWVSEKSSGGLVRFNIAME